MRKLHKPIVVAENENHQFIWLGLDEADLEKGILTNQYLVIDNDEAMLIDPGGYFVFERLYKAVSEIIDPSRVKAVFYSHQDPDVVGSINLLEGFFPKARIYISELWIRFLPHLGTLSADISGIPDEGTEIELGRAKLRAIPAHFLHSPGNFTLYDEVTGVLFSGDIGAAVYPGNEWYLFVEDFQRHIRYMEGFHKRYLCCRKALQQWLRSLEGLDIKVVAPQHGAIFVGDKAAMFLEWLRRLDKIGVDYLYPGDRESATPKPY